MICAIVELTISRYMLRLQATADAATMVWPFCLRGARSWRRSAPAALVAMALSLAALVQAGAQAQQPIRPLPRNGPCPLGYHGSGDYCVPSSNPATRGAIEKSGSGCPLGFYGSGNYCLSSPSNKREAIPKQGNSCPLGWFGSGSYCVKTR